MRLLHTSEHTLCEFTDNEIPPYAILSHTWTKNEVTYYDFLQGKRSEKIQKSCRLAASESWSYIWIDTCCIDKSSSAELSEAINSMYRWYQGAEVCYAYLEDVLMGTMIDSFSESRLFTGSRWFTRGWTLQELLAPPRIVFFDNDWRAIGSRRTLQAAISKATGIRCDQLNSPIKASVAAKMSWMSHRKTTRVEDMAYCLLGLFEVNMPLLYGEGERAFIRLQEEIIQHSDDQTIFAWAEQGLEFSGMLARHPSAFADSGDIVQAMEVPYAQKVPYRMTNMGLEIQFPIFDGYHDFDDAVTEDGVTDQMWRFEVPLGCKRLSDETQRVFVTLKQCGSRKASRINLTNINTLHLPNERSEVQYRTFFVASESSLLFAPNTEKPWDTPKIRLSALARWHFQYRKDVSFGSFFPEPPQWLRVSDWASPQPSEALKGGVWNGGNLDGGNNFQLVGDDTVVSNPSIVREPRAVIFKGRASGGFLVYWMQIPRSMSPPKINILWVTNIGGGVYGIFTHFQFGLKPTTLELDETDGVCCQTKENKYYNVRLKHEIQGGHRRLVINVDVNEIAEKE